MADDGDYLIYSSQEGRLEAKSHQLVEKLLCETCEQLFSKWEDYASRFFRSKVPLTGHALGKHFRLSGVDYKPMKLFLMSILWRMAITSNKLLRGKGELGVHKERMRKLLLASNPGESWRYGCSIVAILVDEEHVSDLIVPTSSFVLKGRNYYRIVIGGFALTFYVASHPPPKKMDQLLFKESGDFILGRMELSEIPFLAEMVTEVSAQDLN